MAAFEALCLNMRGPKPNSLCSKLRISTRTFHTSPRRCLPDSKPRDEPLPNDEAPFEVDLETKTVNTVVGPLPLSPLMDPSFYEARQKFTKPKAAESSTSDKTKFRRLLERNPYGRLPLSSLSGPGKQLTPPTAHALATPPRKCTATKTVLPNYFLHQFQLVAHPTTSEPWFVPQGLLPAQKKPPPPPSEDASSPEPAETPWPAPPKPQKTPSGQSGYLLARKDLHRELGTPATPLYQAHRALLRQGTHLLRGFDKALNQAVWREDMESFLLATMRRRAVEDLLFYAGLVEQQGRKYLVRCASWDEVKGHKHRGCLLVLDGSAGAGIPRLSTMGIEGARVGGELVVHDLRRVLGEEGVERLRGEGGVFKEGGLFLLGRRRTMDLQLLLWKLQGFLAFESEPAVSV